jgi:lysophospholipase L1-like esterase
MRLILKQHRPKLWVVVLTASLFSAFDRTAGGLASCLSDDAVVKDLVFKTLKNPIEKYRYISRLICFNQTITQTFGRFIKPYTNATGFEPLDGKLPSLTDQKVPEEFAIDTYQLDMLRKMVATAREHNTEILFAMAPRYYYNYSPHHTMPLIETRIMSICQNLADECGVVLLDHMPSGIPELYEARFFKDHGHLNRAGTKIISTKLAEDIKALVDFKKITLQLPEPLIKSQNISKYSG